MEQIKQTKLLQTQMDQLQKVLQTQIKNLKTENKLLRKQLKTSSETNKTDKANFSSQIVRLQTEKECL